MKSLAAWTKQSKRRRVLRVSHTTQCTVSHITWEGEHKSDNKATDVPVVAKAESGWRMPCLNRKLSWKKRLRRLFPYS